MVRIRMTVHSKEWDSSAHKYFIHQTAKILISISPGISPGAAAPLESS